MSVNTTANEVRHVKEEQEKQGRLLEKVYDHIAFGEKGEQGPAPPVPEEK